MEQTFESNKPSTSRRPKGFDKGNGNFINKASDFLSANEDHEEGKMTKAIENQTSKIPSGVYLALSIGSMVLSAAFLMTLKRKDMANFVGLWAPTFLILGLYNKIVKTEGSDSKTPA